MAIQRYKIALNNALFPLVSTKAQRAVFALLISCERRLQVLTRRTKVRVKEPKNG